VIVLHCGNRDLERIVDEHSVACEFISQSGLYYDGFRGMPVEDMAYLLFETMPEDSSPSAESVLRSLLEILLRKEGKVDFKSLSTFPLVRLMDVLNDLKNDGEVTIDEFTDISRDYMAGSSEIDAVRSFLGKLNRQADSIFGRPRANAGNIKKMLNMKGVATIDIGISGNDVILSYVINHLKYLQSQGKDFGIVLDGITLSEFPQVCGMLRGRVFALSHNDLISSLHGGGRTGEDFFTELTGDVQVNILFNHRSGTSCKKWSEHLGMYHKIRIKVNVAQTRGFMTGANTKGISVDEADEPRVRAETISMLPSSMACIHKRDGILFVEVLS
jgi:hypothetical protein